MIDTSPETTIQSNEPDPWKIGVTKKNDLPEYIKNLLGKGLSKIKGGLSRYEVEDLLKVDTGARTVQDVEKVIGYIAGQNLLADKSDTSASMYRNELYRLFLSNNLNTYSFYHEVLKHTPHAAKIFLEIAKREYRNAQDSFSDPANQKSREYHKMSNAKRWLANSKIALVDSALLTKAWIEEHDAKN